MVDMDEYRLPATRTVQAFAVGVVEEHISCRFDNGSKPTVPQIYSSDKGEMTEQVDAISQSSQSRDTSDVWT